MNILRLQSLKSRVTLFTLMIFVVGIWSLSFYASRKLQADMKLRLGDRQSTIAALIAKQIDYDLRERYQALELVADSLSELSLDDPTAVQKLLDNRPLLNQHFNAGAYVTRLDGTTIATIPEPIKRQGVNYIDRDYISTAIHQGKQSIGQPVIGRVFNAPIIGVGVPIKNKQGVVIGAVAGVINLDKANFLDSITANRFGRTGYFLLQDKKTGRVVTSTDKNWIMQQHPAPIANAFSDGELQEEEEEEEDGTRILTNTVGTEILATTMSIPIANWRALVALPTSEAFAPILDLERHILFATILMTILAGGLTWWMLRRELYPIFLTVKKLKKLSASDHPSELLPVSSQNEVGDLITGFNNLLTSISEQSEALKQSEFRWKFSLEGTGNGLWDWNIPLKRYFSQKHGRKCWVTAKTKLVVGLMNGKIAYIRKTNRMC